VQCSMPVAVREFPTPPQGGGLIPPNFRTTPPGFRGKWGEIGEGEEREREGERKREGKRPPWVG